jgi:hypothetical protein
MLSVKRTFASILLAVSGAAIAHADPMPMPTMTPMPAMSEPMPIPPMPMSMPTPLMSEVQAPAIRMIMGMQTTLEMDLRSRLDVLGARLPQIQATADLAKNLHDFEQRQIDQNGMIVERIFTEAQRARQNGDPRAGKMVGQSRLVDDAFSDWKEAQQDALTRLWTVREAVNTARDLNGTALGLIQTHQLAEAAQIADELEELLTFVNCRYLDAVRFLGSGEVKEKLNKFQDECGTFHSFFATIE